jgi:putative transposase
MLLYKAEDAGIEVRNVDPKNTSQRCSRCGKIVKKDLTVRVHKCPYCGLELPRDVNSAKSIKDLAWRSAGLQACGGS